MTDWRLPEHRREVFLDFYEFHLRYGAHPGCVYYLMRYLADSLGWSAEECLWFAFLNGNTQHPPTSMLLFQWSGGRVTQYEEMLRFWRAEYDRLAFDTDRRYHKKWLDRAVYGYISLTDCAQWDFWSRRAEQGFPAMWEAARSIPTFGRLSAFSYLEYLRIMGVPFDCDRLFLEDMDGSRSHRNGLCIVLGLDHLDWHQSNPGFNGAYTRDVLAGLELEGAALLRDARERMRGKVGEQDVSYFTLESTLCTYKGWHRQNRRYPNVYNDMLYDRLIATEKTWPVQDFSIFWDARRQCLPAYLRLEDTPTDPGLDPLKQNWYRETGEVPMMGHEPDMRRYWSGFDEAVKAGSLGRFR
jgi:hypothetical protein